ncbi:MAG: ferritin [Endomicrobiaceae bacterium]|nr:ferritin [Endomicrobiaceae bacterium]
MLKENLSNALNRQFNFELYSSYIYLHMSAYCDRNGLKGFANWLNVQAQEELAHAMHMYEYLLERGNLPVFADIKAPDFKYNNVIDVFEKTLSHEQIVTGRINEIATMALKENDHSSYMFIQWYVNEQVEEEANADIILQQVKQIGENTSMLYALDKELSTRVFINPFPSKLSTN